MAILKKIKAQTKDQLEKIICQGGHVAADNQKPTGYKNILLSIPVEMLEEIDQKRKNNIKTPRNTWILNAIKEKLS